MLGKLISLLAQAKGATAVGVLVVGAATATVASTNPDVQKAINDLETTVGLTTTTTSGPGLHEDACDTGQPEVVAQRNAADKVLRAAWQDAHKALTDLHGGKDTDNKAVNDVVKKYDDQLKGTLDAALDKTASLTLGRVGQNKTPKPSGSAAPTTSPAPSPSGSASPKPSCSPKPSASPSAAAASESPSPSESGKPALQGREAVAARTTLDADIKAVVDQAIADMNDLVKKAQDEVAAIPPADHGKPSDDHGNKPSDDHGNKPSDNPGKKPTPAPTPTP